MAKLFLCACLLVAGLACATAKSTATEQLNQMDSLVAKLQARFRVAPRTRSRHRNEVRKRLGRDGSADAAALGHSMPGPRRALGFSRYSKVGQLRRFSGVLSFSNVQQSVRKGAH